MMTRGKRTGLYKNCGNHLPTFYTLLDTNLQEQYTEPRRTEKERQKHEIERGFHPLFASLLLVYETVTRFRWLSCPEPSTVACRNM